jgi:hypothetical protein
MGVPEEGGRTDSPGRVDAEICVRIQHHPSRVGLPRRLVAHLDAFEDVLVVPDPEPNGIVDAWRAHRACLESMTPSASHLLLLQDDALPMPGFSASLREAIDEQPEAVLCAFAPGFGYLRAQFMQASKDRARLVPLRVGAFVPCVAIAYPRAFIAGLLDWVDHRSSDRQRRQLRGADDGVLAMYCRQIRMQPLLIVPSIVEHDSSLQSIGKLHRREGPHRRAALL